MLISVEGNIGSGKSTLVSHLFDLENCKIMQEPVDLWKNLVGDTNEKKDTNILEIYYMYPERYAYTFQSYTFLTRRIELDKLLKNFPSWNIISERSHLSDKEVFATILKNDSFISDLEFKIYLQWFNYFSETQKYEKIIYVRTDPVIALNRIKKRGRSEEANITLEFIEKIHQAHEQWLMNEKNMDILILDGNLDLDENQDVMRIHKEMIEKFFA